MWTRRCLLGILLSTLSLNPTQGNLRSRGLIDASAIARVGLSKSWTSFVPVRGQILYLTLHISDADRFAAYEVSSRDRVHRFTARNTDRFGIVLGPVGARMAAEDVVETEKALGYDPSLSERSLSQIVLYVQTDRGVLQALDGETGRVIWSATVGNSRYPSYRPSANDRYVATTNGSTLYVMNAVDGRIRWERQLQGIPSAGPVVTNSMVHVATIQGTIESYPLTDGAAAASIYRFSGRSYTAPVASRDSFTWTTDKGAMFLSDADSLSTRFRVQSGAPINSRAAYQHPDTWFVASSNGEIYSVRQLNGDVKWQTTLGRAISSTPAPVGDALFVVTDHNGMYCLSSQDGSRRWWSPGIKQFVSATPKHVYATGASGELVVMDRENGKTVSLVGLPGIDLRYPNLLTDRLYLADSDGIVHCLHETEFEWPHRHVPLLESTPVSEEGEAEVEATTESESPEDSTATEDAGDDDLGFDAADDADLFPDDMADGADDAADPAADDATSDEDADPFSDIGDLFDE